MNIELLRLKNNVDKIIEINQDITFNKDDFTGTDLIDLKDVHVSGNLTKDSMDDICLYLSVSGVMVLPCAITLEEVNHNFSFSFKIFIVEIFSIMGITTISILTFIYGWFSLHISCCCI